MTPTSDAMVLEGRDLAKEFVQGDARIQVLRAVTTLLQAALAAGFGSYAQFHRVFREVRRMTPREFLQSRR